jgi:predicted molibdopterin-dependent oxidoreductase YjgC
MRQLPTTAGLSIAELPDAIADSRVRAMYIEASIAGRTAVLDERLDAALDKLELLVVADSYDSPLAQRAHIVLPAAMFLEKDGTFTNFDRTVQRVRATVPPMGEAKTHLEVVGLLARRFGYNLETGHAAQVMGEIARLVPGYGGVSYARLERSGMTAPIAAMSTEGISILSSDQNGLASLSPRLMASPAR